MKILTLTTQYINNMGALLQCYALSTYLNTFDSIDCKVIQYYPKGWKATWNIIKKPRSVRDVIKIVYELLDVKNLIVRINIIVLSLLNI